MASGTVRKMESAICHSGPSCSYRGYQSAKTIEEVSYEMEVERFYRNIIGEKYFNRYASKSSRQLSSKTTQTEPDISNIPSSYLVLGQRLVDELYTDIGNMINTLYHTPKGYFKDDIEKSELDPKTMRVFRQSKLNPDVKLPDSVIRQIYTGEFQNALHSVFEKTVKLKNSLPYIIEIEQGKVPQPIKNVVKAGEDKVPRTEYENTGIYNDSNPFGNGFCRNQPGCSSDFLGKFEACSADFHGNNHSAENKDKECFQEILNRKNTNGYDPRLAPENFVYKNNLTTQEYSCFKMSVPKQTASKHVETACDRNDLVIIGGKEANFTKPLLARSEGDSNSIAACSSGALKIKDAVAQEVEVASSCVQDTRKKIEKGDAHNKVETVDIHNKVGNASSQAVHNTVEYASGQDMLNKVGNASGQSNKMGNASGQSNKMGNGSSQNMHNKGGNASGKDKHKKIGNASGQNMPNKGGNASGQDVHDKVENACNLNKEKRGNEGGHKAGKVDGSDSKNFIKRNIMMASKISARATTSKLVHDQKFVSHEPGQQTKRNKK